MGLNLCLGAAGRHRCRSLVLRARPPHARCLAHTAPEEDANDGDRQIHRRAAADRALRVGCRRRDAEWAALIVRHDGRHDEDGAAGVRPDAPKRCRGSPRAAAGGRASRRRADRDRRWPGSASPRARRRARISHAPVSSPNDSRARSSSTVARSADSAAVNSTSRAPFACAKCVAATSADRAAGESS